MTLKLKASPKAAKFEYTDGAMEVSWTVPAALEGDELAAMLERIVGFYRAQEGPGPLPERTPGVALEMVQMTHPPMAPVTGNGWAAMAQPEVPARLEGVVELIPPEEQP